LSFAHSATKLLGQGPTEQWTTIVHRLRSSTSSASFSTTDIMKDRVSSIINDKKGHKK